MEVGKPGEESSLIEISKAPERITETTPIILGAAILAQAKIMLLRMECWLRRFPSLSLSL
jgi:hypothetical protein